MVVNLVSNAIKFSPPGGTVNITAGAVQPGGAKISVVDSGPGIEEEMLPAPVRGLCPPRRHDHRAHDGVGLGLAITKALIELHHGNIRVITQPGRGTTMTLELPPAVQ